MKNIYFAVAIAAFAFLACTSTNEEDGSSSSTAGSSSSLTQSSNQNSSSSQKSGVCYISNYIPGVEYCIKGKIGTVISEEDCNKGGGIIQDSCPPKEDLFCDRGNEYYFYGQAITDNHWTCEDFFTISSSSGSRPSSSSASNPSSSSSSDSKTACYVVDDADYGTTCLEGVSAALCEAWAAGQWSMRDSCPSGYKLRCEEYGAYFYDQMWVGRTCDDLE